MHDRTTHNIANGGESSKFRHCSPHQTFSRWIVTHSANRHLPYCQPLGTMLKIFQIESSSRFSKFALN